MKKICIILSLLICNTHNISPDNWDAQTYAQESDIQFRVASELISEFPFNGDEQIIDFGCGNGRFAHWLLKKIPSGHIHGIDQSQEQIALAQERHANNPQLSFECADVISFTSTKKYDVALSFMTLHWLGNDQSYAQSLKQIANALKPGGRTWLAHLAEGGIPFIDDLKATLAKPEWQSYGDSSHIPIHYPNKETIEQAIDDAGFTIHKLTFVVKSARVDSLDSLISHFSACPLVPCIPKELVYAFYSEAAQRAIKYNHITVHADGTVTYSGTDAILELVKQ